MALDRVGERVQPTRRHFGMAGRQLGALNGARAILSGMRRDEVLADLLEQVVVGCEEEREPGSELVHGEAGRDRR
mgnify:CR=1 FL=1